MKLSLSIQGAFMRSRSILTVAAVALLGLGFAAQARADEPQHTIVPNVNDPAIVDTNPTRGDNLAWLPTRPVGKLLVFLPSGGALNLPSEFKSVGTEGARLGYHTIVLAYRNEVGINAAPPLGCGATVEPPALPPNCAFDVHRELLDGRGESSVVSIDRANSIENRLAKLLQYLATTFPGEGWAPFLDTTGSEPAPKWSELVIAGQSLGSGESVLIGMVHSVYRVAMFAGFTDAAHGWVAPGLTPTSRYFALIHQRDNFFTRACSTYLALGLAPSCPLPGFTIPAAPPDPANPLLIDNRQPPFGTHQLVFNLNPAPNPPMAVPDPFHSSTSRDGWIARESDGTPSRKLVNGWRAILGDSDADTYLDTADNCPLVANADQTDSDHNGSGDACGPTFASSAPAGSVPATLSLTLGTAAAFVAFTPGVDRDYDTSMTASVISTAGDARLSLSDPGSDATGRLTNGTFSLAEPLQASASSARGLGAVLAPLSTTAGSPLSLLTYSGPVSNDAVTIAFRQHIAPTQALRTGAYTKTLTFTLSTTTP
jgi:hypothetical protein